jgi:hypothetical protein
MSVTALASKKDDPRVELRRAVADAQEAWAAVDKQRAAIERAQQLVYAAKRKAESASKAVAAARDQDVQQLAAAIASGETVSPQATVRAHAMEIEATDAVMMARAAYERLEIDLKDVEREAERAAKDVNAAVAAVLAPAAKRMTEEASVLRAQYLARVHAIDAMCVSLDGFKRLRFDVSEEEHRQLCASVRQSWLDVIEALKINADAAELPE